MDIINDKVARQSGFTSQAKRSFSGVVYASKNQIKIQHIHPKLGKVSLDGEFLKSGGDRFIKFEGEADKDRECAFNLTWSNAATGQIVASKPTPKSTPVSASTTQSASAAGKFDGEWKGKLSCFEMEQADGPQFEPSPKDETEVLLEVSLAGKC